MSSIFISVINLLTEALFNKVCDYTANKLKEGDLTDEKCRQLIVRELDDIKSKLDGLARRDLLSSVSFLSDGICLLHLSLDKSNEDGSLQERSEENASQAAQSMMMPECNSADSMHSECSIVNEALLLSHKTLTIASKMRFISAKSSFEKAYTKATEAFSNEALSTEDRILATKLRVISKILECLEDPAAAAASCKIYLQQLHDLPAVRKIFSVHFHSGVKSRFNKTKRKENVRFVMIINYLVFHYTKIFAKTAPDSLFNWPKIRLSKRSFHPLLVENDIIKKIEKSGVHPPNQFRFCESNDTWAEYAAVNGKGELIVKSDDNKCLHIITNKGEVQSSFCFSKEDTKASNFEILAVTTNGEDDVYSVSRFKGPQEFHYKLSIFDVSTGNVKHDVLLECLRGPGESHHSVCIAVNNKNDILITKQDEARVYVLDSSGQLKHSFAIETWHLIKHLSISAKNEVIVAELIGKAVGIYTEDGTFKNNIEVPGLHKVCGLAFNHVTKTIIVLTEVMKDCLNDHQLESYSETGEQLQTLPLPEKRSGFYKITSHPNGPVAVVHKTGVIFIQH